MGTMRHCLLMHYAEGPSLDLTEQDMAPAMAAFAGYADDLSAAGVLLSAEALEWARRNPATGWGVIEIRPVARTVAGAARRTPPRHRRRRDADGRFVPLGDQDPGDWDRPLIARGRPCCPVRTDTAGQDGSSTRRPSSRFTAARSAPKTTISRPTGSSRREWCAHTY
jgi:hypothetical protein